MGDKILEILLYIITYFVSRKNVFLKIPKNYFLDLCLPKKKVGDKILKILLYTFPFFVSRKKKWETRF